MERSVSGEAERRRTKSAMMPYQARVTSILHPVQPPPLRHAFELVNAAIREADFRLRHQFLDRARDQDSPARALAATRAPM
jgi:hypothetical protein